MLRTGELLAFFPEQPEARGHGWSASMLRGDRTPRVAIGHAQTEWRSPLDG